MQLMHIILVINKGLFLESKQFGSVSIGMQYLGRYFSTVY